MSLVSKISRRKLDGLVSRYASTEKTLEVGAFGSPSYGQFFSHKVGIDIRPGPGVDVVGSVYELPFQDGEFQTVLCLSVLEHLEDPKKAIQEMRRVLKPGGRILISVPFMFPIHDAPGDYWRFTKFGLKLLFKEGWEIEELKAETSVGETYAVLFQRLAYQTKLSMNKVSKAILFILASVLSNGPSLVRGVYGGIQKKVAEPEAFASAFFMAARKP
jgi:SAM-dependent methyltransferase